MSLWRRFRDRHRHSWVFHRWCHDWDGQPHYERECDCGAHRWSIVGPPPNYAGLPPRYIGNPVEGWLEPEPKGWWP